MPKPTLVKLAMIQSRGVNCQDVVSFDTERAGRAGAGKVGMVGLLDTAFR